MRRRSVALAVQAALLAAALAGAAASSRPSDWTRPGLLVLLLALALASDALAIEWKRARGRVYLTGSAMALVLAMCFLGPAPAAAIGLATMLVSCIRLRLTPAKQVANLVVFTAYPLMGGVLARLAFDHGLGRQPLALGLVVFVIYVCAIVLNFGLVAALGFLMPAGDAPRLRTMLLPMLPVEGAMATLVLAFALIYREAGLIALTVLAVALFAFQGLTHALLTSQDRAEQLARRSTELASLQVGVLAALVQTLSLRDKMTARHSAAVARYAKAIAAEVGCDAGEQDLVHTAGLLHDVGKFIFPDSILFARRRLTEEEWEVVRRHPAQGARVVERVDGYGPVAEIIHAHHERVDGGGYPRGLAGEDVPLLSRMISIADTFDVMTARDSYRDPVSRGEAVAELRRVSGTQLDGRLVDAFVRVLERSGLAFQHTTDADFERELDFTVRVAAFVERRDAA